MKPLIESNRDLANRVNCAMNKDKQLETEHSNDNHISIERLAIYAGAASGMLGLTTTLTLLEIREVAPPLNPVLIAASGILAGLTWSKAVRAANDYSRQQREE